MIDFLSAQQSKQTIRKYLCLYLDYQNIAALAPAPKVEKELTQDEKNMRWALNKFFYSKHKNSLNTAYTFMLKEKYCTADGQLVEKYPSFDQFRYFYRKTKSMQKYYISRDGIKDYQRNNRPLLGDGVQQFAPAVGTGMLDSTICDIYLVPEPEPVLEIPAEAYIPDAYIADPRYKMEIYRRLAEMEYAERDDLLDEIIDRFGELPPEVEMLWRLASIKGLCRLMRIRGINVRPGMLRITFGERANVNTEVFMKLLNANKNSMSFMVVI